MLHWYSVLAIQIPTDTVLLCDAVAYREGGFGVLVS